MTPPPLPVPIPAFTDNYLWLLQRGRHALVVDPGEAGGISDYLQRHQLQLAAILLTHHHADHTGGVAALRREWPQAEVWGPADNRMPAAIHTVGHGDQVDLQTMGLQFQVIAVPGHTLSHIAYFAAAETPPLLFCGDTLFSIGCGRLFEGTPQQMQQSLDRFAALPAATLAFPAHEYTLANCRFALAVEPDNRALHTYHEQAQQRRQAQQPTLPTTLATELQCNPFMRTREPTVIAAAQQREPGCGEQPGDVMGVIRRWKDAF